MYFCSSKFKSRRIKVKDDHYFPFTCFKKNSVKNQVFFAVGLAVSQGKKITKPKALVLSVWKQTGSHQNKSKTIMYISTFEKKVRRQKRVCQDMEKRKKNGAT